jgi:hypothetical protein
MRRAAKAEPTLNDNRRVGYGQHTRFPSLSHVPNVIRLSLSSAKTEVAPTSSRRLLSAWLVLPIQDFAPRQQHLDGLSASRTTKPWSWLNISPLRGFSAEEGPAMAMTSTSTGVNENSV